MIPIIKMNQSTSKLFAFLTIAFILTNSISLVAGDITWTQYSDTTSVGFVVEQPAEEPEQPCDEDTSIDETEQDREYERSILESKYGKWTCINNKLQRINIINGQQVIEYDGVCGITKEKAVEQKSMVDILIFLPFILFILIIIILILITATLLRQ